VFSSFNYPRNQDTTCQGNICMGYFEEDRKLQSILCWNSRIGVVCASKTTILVLLLLFVVLFFITIMTSCIWKVFDLSHIMYNDLWM
jgi:hypothetical protein